MIPISELKFGEEEEKLILSALRSGKISQGPLVKEFEDYFARKSGVNHAIAVSNGTISLIACLQVLNLKPGDEVITTPFTFAATLNAIIQAGATAVFADVSYEDFNIDPDSVRKKITNRTKAIIPVHLYGQMADMKSISKIARDYSLRVIEDASQAHFAKQDSDFAGSFDLGSFSFYATKNLTSGEGGLITTNDDETASKLRILRNQGMVERYKYVSIGNNYRMTDLQAALVLPQMYRYGDIVQKRSENAEFYSSHLSSVQGLELPLTHQGKVHVWHQYTLRVTRHAKINRDQLAQRLDDSGVGYGVYYPKPLFDYEPYRNNPQIVYSECPIAQKLSAEVLSIPVHQHLTDNQRSHVVESIEQAFRAG